MISLGLFFLLEKTVFKINKTHIDFFLGVGWIGRKKYIAHKEIHSIEYNASKKKSRIVVKGVKDIKLGENLTSEQKEFLVSILHKFISNKKNSSATSQPD
jgi:hypothetical protein